MRPSLPLAKAKKILGKHIVTSDDVARAWGTPRYPMQAVPFSSDFLKAIAEKNKSKSTCWILIYCNGNSLEKQHKLYEQMFFSHQRGSDELQERERWIFRTHHDSGYHLINFFPRWHHCSGEKIRRLITRVHRVGIDLQMPIASILSEAVITLHKIQHPLLSELQSAYTLVCADGSFVRVLYHAEKKFLTVVDFGHSHEVEKPCYAGIPIEVMEETRASVDEYPQDSSAAYLQKSKMWVRTITSLVGRIPYIPHFLRKK